LAVQGTAESRSVALDAVKWFVVIVLVGGGVFGNWYFGEESLFYRVSALAVLAIGAGLIGFQTEKGAAFWTLLKEARIEMRRVVWPTREEAVQTTLIVLLLLVIVAAILGLLDFLLGAFVTSVIG
jgi:preprotein translocase subunit SecE